MRTIPPLAGFPTQIHLIHPPALLSRKKKTRTSRSAKHTKKRR